MDLPAAANRRTNVQMKSYTVGEVRQNLASALDNAERDGVVVIRRRNAIFELRLRADSKRAAASDSLFEIQDPAVENGEWHWASTDAGLVLKTDKRKRPRRR